MSVLAQVLDHFKAGGFYPENEWCFNDDDSTLGLDHRSPDGTKFWLDLNRDGSIEIYWRPGGDAVGGGKSVRYLPQSD